MSIALLDVNVLVALINREHTSYEMAHRWFGQNSKHGWATCPITVNGLVRVLSRPGYISPPTNPEKVGALLRNACSTKDHHFWAESVSLLDETLFRLSAIKGHGQITDAYLLGLAVRQHGRLVTFDRSIPRAAVPTATEKNLVVIPIA